MQNADAINNVGVFICSLEGGSVGQVRVAGRSSRDRGPRIAVRLLFGDGPRVGHELLDRIPQICDGVVLTRWIPFFRQFGKVGSRR